jgi:hypothetical protein
MFGHSDPPHWVNGLDNTTKILPLTVQFQDWNGKPDWRNITPLEKGRLP